jgi:CheY-like chemotaxis protein
MTESVAPFEATQPATRRPRVLVVEDHPVNRQTLRLMLGDRVDLHEAVNGLDGVQAADAWDFDLVLMDIDMPVMDGLAASRALHANEAHAHRPAAHIILMTCATATSPERDVIASGASGYMARPITEGGLFAAIATAVGSAADDSLTLISDAA